MQYTFFYVLQLLGAITTLCYPKMMVPRLKLRILLLYNILCKKQ